MSCPLQNLLFVRSSKIIKALCENTIVFDTWKVWSIIRRIEGRAGMSSLLDPIHNNPEFMPSLSDSGFKIWYTYGICRVSDLFNEGSLLSFEDLVIKYQQRRSNFFRFLQIRDYIFKSTSLVTNPSMSVIEKIPLNPPLCKQISCFYNALCLYEVVTTQDLRRLWEEELQLTITEEDWDRVWSQANKISVCNMARAIQLRIVHRLHITPLLSNSPLYLRCKVEVGDYTHFIWDCSVIRTHWSKVVQYLSRMFGLKLQLGPLSLNLGLPDICQINLLEGL